MPFPLARWAGPSWALPGREATAGRAAWTPGCCERGRVCRWCRRRWHWRQKLRPVLLPALALLLLALAPGGAHAGGAQAGSWR